MSCDKQADQSGIRIHTPAERTPGHGRSAADIMDEKSQKILELRDKFFKKLEDDGPPDSKEFHSADMHRVKSGDDWLRRFLEHNEYNVQEALKMLWETCEWRRNFGTNEITESNVRRDYLEDGVCFGFGKDKDGKKLFVIKSKLHTKGSRDFQELQRCIVYWFERLERETNGDQISLFFDMIDAGLSNLDMELTKYLIGLFKNYYPNFLNYIIILEMPWVLNAAFNIIKSWLPAKAIPKIKFVKKSTLKEFVDPSIAMKCWGGNNDYTFVFVSESPSGGLVNGNGKSDNRKVHFAGSSPITEQPTTGFGDQQKGEDSMLLVEPDILTFNKSGNEIMGTITLKNSMLDQNVSYKIKTTSPDKFKVRPSTGILTSSQKITVTITLQPGYTSRSLLPGDRFLIMCLPIKDAKMSPQELVDFWKSNGTNAKQHRLICRDGTEGIDGLKSSMVSSTGASSGDYTIGSLFSKITQMQDQQKKFENDITFLKKLLLISTVLIILLLTWIIYTLNSIQSPVQLTATSSVVNIPPIKSHDEI